jgi:hypothetical protein
MTEPKPADTVAAPAPGSPAAAQPPAEWKPEPRRWTWKDLFTAPMLAFKPKCMAVSALTILALAGIHHGWGRIAQDISSTPLWWGVASLAIALGLAVFGLGATFVAVFMKADLLDDEFLGFGEALGQFRSRILPAIAVPLFLVVLALGVHGLLIWLPMLASSIPWIGGFAYAVLYPLAFAAGIFTLLLTVAIALSGFVFPAIVAIRRHGWFDNVVDTIEAVGTKPHVLVASLVLTGVLVLVALGIGHGAKLYLKGVAGAMPARETASEPALVENRASDLSSHCLAWMPACPLQPGQDERIYLVPPPSSGNDPAERSAWMHWGPGLIAGAWQIAIGLLLAGYALNLFIAGGMLTYLLVREDDYWDDEDLEDLDQLAKELEDEAKREDGSQAKAEVAAPAAAPAAPPAEPPKPA